MMRSDRKVRVKTLPGTYLPCVLACGVLFVAVIGGCTAETGRGEVERPAVAGVVVEAVAPVRSHELYETSGTVRSENTSVIASRVMGVVTSLNVREGERVKAGRLLITIDDKDARERANAAAMALEAARQNRDLSEVTFRRYASLFEQKIIARQEMDQVQTRRDVASAEYERARAMAEEAKTFLGFTRITSPVDGVVTRKHIDAGSMASPGMPLLTVETLGDVYVEAAMDEGLRGRVKAGMPADVVDGSLGRSLKGTVREVLPDISPTTRTFIVKIDIGEGDLTSGLFVRVKIPVGEKDALVVPPGALIRKGQLTGVYVVDATGVVTYRLIKEGRATDKGIEVISGLKPHERIITQGVHRGVDGGIIAQGASQ